MTCRYRVTCKTPDWKQLFFYYRIQNQNGTPSNVDQFSVFNTNVVKHSRAI